MMLKNIIKLSFVKKIKLIIYLASHPDSFMYKYYPKSIKQKIIIYGVWNHNYIKLSHHSRPELRIEFLSRVQWAELICEIELQIIFYSSGRSSWKFYKLRTLCTKLNYVEYSGMKGKKYVNEDYPSIRR